MTKAQSYEPSRSLPSRIGRRLTQWRVAAPLNAHPTRPIISFTFDDFPKSSAETGAELLADAGGHGTYYACTSLSGQNLETGQQFTGSDIETLQAAGHEIGAHTHSHLDCARAGPNAIQDDIDENLRQLSDLGVSEVTQFAYPYGETRLALKRILKGRFETARGILPGRNDARSDRMQLRAFQLTPDPKSIARAAAAIQSAEHAAAWIVVFTHDVRAKPSPYGVQTKDLKELIQMGQDIGADLLTVSEAMIQMGAPRDE